MSSRIFFLLCLWIITGCSSPAEPQETPKKLMGELCKSVFQPKTKILPQILQSKDFSQAAQIFSLLYEEGKSIEKNYVPKGDSENLKNFHDYARGFTESAQKGKEEAEKKDLPALNKSYGKLRSWCLRCHTAYPYTPDEF